MGSFALIMIAGSILFALDATLDSLGVIFLLIFLLSYIVPFVLNFTRLRMCDFVKGVLYAIYLGPTYVNIMTIYSIVNIHDVSWGNRPTQQNEKFKRIENEKGILYKDYRSNFLIIWIITNIAVAAGLVNASRQGNVVVILALGIFLVFIMVFKIILSTAHICKSHYENFRVNKYMNSCKSHAFDDVATHETQEPDDIFTVYYDEEGNDYRISKDNIVVKKFLGNLISKSAIKSQNMYRGFNLARLVEEQALARQGTKLENASEKKTLNFINLATLRQREIEKEPEEKPSDDDLEEDDGFSPVESPSPILKRKKMGLGHLNYNNGLKNIMKSYTKHLEEEKKATIDQRMFSEKFNGPDKKSESNEMSKQTSNSRVNY
jgi:hypothetical protein